MKKVLFTATVDSHILQFHLPYLKLFKDKGYEVHVATNGNEEIPYCDVKHVVSFERNPFKINNLKAIKQLKKVINKEHFDIIHTHTPMGSVVTRLAAKQARRKYHTKVLYTAHGFHFYDGAPLINWLLFYPVEWYLAKYTDTLILINQEDYNRAKNRFSKRCSDIQYVPGVGIDENKFNFTMTAKEKLELRKSLGLKKDDFVMIYAAELNKNKNQIFLIEVMQEIVKKHKNIHLLLAGIDSYNGYYQKKVKEFNLDKNIHFLGYRKDIPKLLKISNIAVSSSLREGLPVNVMEALEVGLPVVGLKCRGMQELMQKYTINNKNQFIKQIEKLINNKKYYDEMHNYALNKSKEYKLSEIQKIVEKIYFRNEVFDETKF